MHKRDGDFIIENIRLSQHPGGQADMHDIPGDAVRAEIHESLRYGRVLNEGANGHLAGNVVDFRAEKTVSGDNNRYEFKSIDSASLQTVMLEKSRLAEVDRIAGQAVDSGSPTIGELFELFEGHRQLGNWLILEPEEKENISAYHGRVAEERARTRNPFNVAAGKRAARIQALVEAKNPGAARAMTWPQEGSFNARVNQILKGVIVANDMRKVRLLQWMFDENSHLAAANQQLDRLAEDPELEFGLADLKGIAWNIHYRVQPFNQMAYSFEQAGHSLARVTDPELVSQLARDTQDGIVFQRQHNYFMRPFRQLNEKWLKSALNKPVVQVDSQLPRIERRIAKLEEVSAGGHYKRLISGLLMIATDTASAFHNLDMENALEHADRFKWLLTYHCFPNDNQSAIWYHSQL